MTIEISIRKDYTKLPGGRKIKDGKGSGEGFKELIKSRLVNGTNTPLLIDLDDTPGFESSFLDEAFGGLIRDQIVPVGWFSQFVTLKSSNEFLKKKILQYVLEAENYVQKKNL